MGQIAALTLCLRAKGALSSTETSDPLVVPDGFTAAIIRIECGTVTGTSPTLNAYIQQGQRDLGSETFGQRLSSGTYNFKDIISFSQITASNSARCVSVVNGGNAEFAQTDGTLTAGTIQSGAAVGGLWRVKLVVGGTNPSFANTEVVVTFLP